MKLKTIVSSAFVVGILSGASAQAQDVSVQFPAYYSQVYSALNGAYSPPPAGYYAGASTSLDRYWNVVNNSVGGGDGVPAGPITEADRVEYVPSPIPNTAGSYVTTPGILDSTGAASPLTFILANATLNRGANGGAAGFPDSNNDVPYSQFYPTANLSKFLVSGLETSEDASNPVSLLIGGLDPTLSYNLTAYVGSDYSSGSQALSVTLGSQTYYLTTDNGTLTGLTGSESTTPTSALADYVTFYDVAGSDLESEVMTVNGQGNGLAGFQITPGTMAPVVPEPSTYVLMGVGLLSLVLLRKRKLMFN
jgi:hypothetical protein